MALGANCKIYRNTASWDSPTWSEITEITKFTLDPKKERVKVRTRESMASMGKTVGYDWEQSGEILVKASSANYAALEAAYYADTTVDLLILNGPYTTEGSEGIRAEFDVTKWTKNQDPNVVQMAEFTIDLALDRSDTDSKPKRATVAAGPTLEYDDIPVV